MKFFSIAILLASMAVMLNLQSCYYDNEAELYGPPPPIPACDTLIVSYQDDIVGIIDNRGCFGCHNNRGASGNVNLEGYDNVKIHVDNGGLLGSIRHDPGFSAMPQGGSKIPELEIQVITCWIEQGALNN